METAPRFDRQSARRGKTESETFDEDYHDAEVEYSQRQGKKNPRDLK
jgi:hypothetical protein